MNDNTLRLAAARWWRDYAGNILTDVPAFVQQLAWHEPVVLITSVPLTEDNQTWRWSNKRASLVAMTAEREQAMSHAISATLVCLRHLVDAADPHMIADLLNERGHAWLGEPLALWLRGEGYHDAAVQMLVDRLPILPEFAEWSRQRDGSHGLVLSVDGNAPQTVTFDDVSAEGIARAISEQAMGFTARVDGDTIFVTSDDTIAAFQVETLGGQTTQRENPRRTRHDTTSWQARAGQRRSRTRSTR